MKVYQFWAGDNRHAIREGGNQVGFTVDFWAVVIVENVVGPYLLLDRHNVIRMEMGGTRHENLLLAMRHHNLTSWYVAQFDGHV
jgi:hypothetical protein